MPEEHRPISDGSPGEIIALEFQDFAVLRGFVERLTRVYLLRMEVDFALGPPRHENAEAVKELRAQMKKVIAEWEECFEKGTGYSSRFVRTAALTYGAARFELEVRAMATFVEDVSVQLIKKRVKREGAE